VGIGFLFAPHMHKAMKHAADVRRELGFRTIFNLLGPLTNPARVKSQVVGVFDSRWTAPLAEVLQKLGSEHAFVVHGEDGLDEITLTNNTRISELNKCKIKNYSLNPEELGFRLCAEKDLKGGTAEDNSRIIRDLLDGKTGPKQDIVVLNAAAAIAASGKAGSIQQGVDVARQSIESGAARQKLEDLCRVSHS
jgi:anthranilate phosphoribosyltransferase